MPRAHKPDAGEELIETILVGIAIEELKRSTDDQTAALRRALLVLVLITDHDGQRDVPRVFRTFLLSGIEPLTRGFVHGSTSSWEGSRVSPLVRAVASRFS